MNLLIRYFAALLLLLLGAAGAVRAANDSVLPRPPVAFTGKLEPKESDSTSVYPVAVEAPAGAPNILLVMTDDVGFGAVSTFGGPVPTPNLDQLAAQGLRYNQFHTTGICSPTRAALLTGRNHHAVGMGTLTDIASPYPGYTGRIPPTAATVARILRDNGYNTAMFGKDHNILPAERSASGPFDQWPTSRGFEYFYGFITGDTDQWNPALFENTSAVDGSHRPEGYILDRDLADHAINWIHNQKAAAPGKPFFAYYATGSGHAPHQAPKDWIAKFEGKFDQGWDKLREQILTREKALGVVPPNTEMAPRPQEVPAWDSLSAQEKKVYARFMEVYAASIAFQDAQIGRVLDEIKRMGLADNTLVVFIEGDNGASSEAGPSGTLNEVADLSGAKKEAAYTQWLANHLDILGGPDTYQSYQVGWTFAMDTPFPWFKQLASHLGGVRNGLVISWPRRIQQVGQVRSQYHHVVDVLPTLLEAAGVQAPTTVDGIKQQPIDGTSMLYTFDDPEAPSNRITQYYEVNGNRGIYHDGWLASTTPRFMPWRVSPALKSSDITTYEWELYDLRTDFSQTQNLATEHPQKLEQMRTLFDTEARKYNVYPIQDSPKLARALNMMMAPGKSYPSEYVYWGPNISLQLLSSPAIYRFPFTIEADIVVPEGGGTGVIVAAGSFFNGWSFYLHEGKPVGYAAVSPLPLPGMQSRVAADRPLSAGPHKVVYRFDKNGEGGTLNISVDGKEVASGDISHAPHVLAGNGESFDTGRDTNVPVSRDYQNGGVFNGEIKRIDVRLKLPTMNHSLP